jgi:hypothetical protein
VDAGPTGHSGLAVVAPLVFIGFLLAVSGWLLTVRSGR